MEVRASFRAVSVLAMVVLSNGWVVSVVGRGACLGGRGAGRAGGASACGCGPGGAAGGPGGGFGGVEQLPDAGAGPAPLQMQPADVDPAVGEQGQHGGAAGRV